jgi:hypothetical protein
VHAGTCSLLLSKFARDAQRQKAKIQKVGEFFDQRIGQHAIKLIRNINVTFPG